MQHNSRVLNPWVPATMAIYINEWDHVILLLKAHQHPSLISLEVKTKFLTMVHSPFQICPAPPHLTSHARPLILNLAHCAPTTTASWLLLQCSRLLLPWGTCAVLGKLSSEIPTAHPCLPLKFVLKCCLLWPSFLKLQPFWCPSIPRFIFARALSSTFQQTTKLTFVLVLLH